MEEYTIVEVTEAPERSPGDGFLRGTAQREIEDAQKEIEDVEGPWNEFDLGKRNRKLLESGYMSDFTTKVENTKFQCHSLIVSASSPKIAKMVRKSKTLELRNVALNHFRYLLQIIYGGYAENLDTLEVEDILAVAQASNVLQVYSAIAYCTKILRTHISPTSACQILEFAGLVSDEALKVSCIKAIKEHTDEVLANQTFIKCKHATLELILSQKELHGVTELDLFLACARWAEGREQPRQALGSALGLIRFRQTTSIDFAEKVMPTNLLTAEEEKCLTKYFLTGNGEMPAGFSNEQRERREIQVETSKFNVGPKEEVTFGFSPSSICSMTPEVLSKYPLRFSVNADLFLIGVKIQAWRTDKSLDENFSEEINVILKDRNRSLIAEAKLLELVGNGKYFNVTFTYPIPIVANRIYALHYSNNSLGLKHLAWKYQRQTLKTKTNIEMCLKNEMIFPNHTIIIAPKINQ